MVNLADRGRYLQGAMELKVADAKIGDQVKKVLPEIRNGILLVLSGKRAEEVSSAEGKQRLQLEIRHAATKALRFDFELPPLMKALPEVTDQSFSAQANALFNTVSALGPATTPNVSGLLAHSIVFQSFLIHYPPHPRLRCPPPPSRAGGCRLPA